MNFKIVKQILQKIVIFTALKNRCILHGRVFVMQYDNYIGEETLIETYSIWLNAEILK